MFVLIFQFGLLLLPKIFIFYKTALLLIANFFFHTSSPIFHLQFLHNCISNFLSTFLPYLSVSSNFSFSVFRHIGGYTKILDGDSDPTIRNDHDQEV